MLKKDSKLDEIIRHFYLNSTCYYLLNDLETYPEKIKLAWIPQYDNIQINSLGKPGSCSGLCGQYLEKYLYNR